MNEKRQISEADMELIGTLAAISTVSKRLARKLLLLAAQGKTEKGEKENGQKYYNDHRRTAQCRRGY